MRTSGSAPVEKPDVHVSDQHQAAQDNPEDPIGRLKKAAPILKNEHYGKHENNIAGKHPPDSRHKSR
jgi:molybdopterin synthase catalytic subunit